MRAKKSLCAQNGPLVYGSLFKISLTPTRTFCWVLVWVGPKRAPPPPRDALQGKGPRMRPQRRLGRRLEEVAKAVGGGYCRLQMPLKLALGMRETVAGHRLGALEGGGGCVPPF